MSTSSSNKRVAGAAGFKIGLIYFVFGLNFFLHFIPGSAQPLRRKSGGIPWGVISVRVLRSYGQNHRSVSRSPIAFGLFHSFIAGHSEIPITINILLFHTALAPDFRQHEPVHDHYSFISGMVIPRSIQAAFRAQAVQLILNTRILNT